MTIQEICDAIHVLTKDEETVEWNHWNRVLATCLESLHGWRAIFEMQKCWHVYSVSFSRNGIDEGGNELHSCRVEPYKGEEALADEESPCPAQAAIAAAEKVGGE